MIQLSTTTKFRWLVSLLLFIVTISLQAQVNTRRINSGSENVAQFGVFGPQGTIATLELPALDATRLMAEDQQAGKNGRPPRVSVRQVADVDLTNAGTVFDRNGYRVRQYQILSPGAGALSAKLDRLRLAPGARLFLYDAAQTVLVGPVTAKQNLTGGVFNTGHVTGDRLILELQEPLAVAGQSLVHLSGVNNFYNPRGPFGGLRPAGACENNLVCFPAYQTEGEGVALILVDFNSEGQYICTGAIVNDARQSFRSFFLTAFHCIDLDGDQVNDANEAASTADWTFYFKYQSPTCTPNQDDNVYVTLNGATYRAGSAASDFTLLELNAQAPQAESLSFLGWDRSSNLASSVFGIHHPNGSLKKISFGGATTPVGVAYAPGGGYNVVSGTSFLQLSWNDGVTEGGSSGSPLFDGASRRIIGQLLGGSSFCSPPSAQDDPDQYGRFFTSWTGGGTENTRLSNWLDPTGISGNTTNLAVPTVSGPAAFTGSATFSLNTLDASIVSWSVTGGSGVLAATSGTGNTANLTATGSGTGLTITFTVNAGQSYPIQFSKTFNVGAPTNNPPVPPAGGIADQTATVGTPFSFTVPAFADPDAGQTLTYSASGLPALGLSFDPATRIISGTPSATGVVGVTITADDGNGGTASDSFNITINPAVVPPPPNTPPTAPVVPSLTATVGVAFSYTLPAFTDPDPGQILSLSATGLPANGLSFSGGVISGTPSATGVISVTVTADDGNGGTASASFTIIILPGSVEPPINNPPVAPTIPNQTATVGVTYVQLIPAFTDPDGQAIIIRAYGLPPGLSYRGTPSGIVKGTPTTAGVYSVSLVGIDVSNGTIPGGLSDTAVYTITVNPAPAGGALTLLEPTYDCATGAITFHTSGGDGTPITYLAIGVQRADATSNTGTVEPGLRADPKPLVITATQSGVTTSYTYDFAAYCAGVGARKGVVGVEAETELAVTVLGNPTTDRTVQVRIRGAAGERIRLRVNNVQGGLLDEQIIEPATADQSATVRLGQSAGVYLLRVNAAGRQVVTKIIRQ